LGQGPPPLPLCFLRGLAFTAAALGKKIMTASAIISGIIAFIKAIPIIDGWFQQAIAAYMNGQTNATLAAIADAADFAARAQTDADRYVAAQKWVTALARSKVTA
jgi:hypothetical protein